MASFCQHVVTHSSMENGPPRTSARAETDQQLADVGRLMERVEPISLSDMSNVSLLKRTDTKYVLSTDQLYSALAALPDHYRVLDIGGTRLHRYRTLYFDTPDLVMYRRHHNDALNRYKIRFREYLDTHLTFFEIKFKRNKRQTIKNRLRTSAVATTFGGETAAFVQDHSPYFSHALGPKLWNEFTRITMVSKHKAERLTLDVNFQFHNNHHWASLPGIAIAEVKQEKHTLESDFVRQMRILNRRSSGFSKYCAGVMLLYTHVKSNRLKPRLLLVYKLVRGGIGHGHVR